MAQVVAAQMLVAQGGDDFVPVGGVAQDGGADPAAARSGEQAGIGAGRGGEPVGDQIADLGDERDLAGAFAFGALVDQAAGSGVVCRRTVQVQVPMSMSAARIPDTSPMRAAVQAAKMTTSPQPGK
jgi:hypothetical protein